jgi:hypothetical protein
MQRPIIPSVFDSLFPPNTRDLDARFREPFDSHSAPERLLWKVIASSQMTTILFQGLVRHGRGGRWGVGFAVQGILRCTYTQSVEKSTRWPKECFGVKLILRLALNSCPCAKLFGSASSDILFGLWSWLGTWMRWRWMYRSFKGGSGCD